MHLKTRQHTALTIRPARQQACVCVCVWCVCVCVVCVLQSPQVYNITQNSVSKKQFYSLNQTLSQAAKPNYHNYIINCYMFSVVFNMCATYILTCNALLSPVTQFLRQKHALFIYMRFILLNFVNYCCLCSRC